MDVSGENTWLNFCSDFAIMSLYCKHHQYFYCVIEVIKFALNSIIIYTPCKYLETIFSRSTVITLLGPHTQYFTFLLKTPTFCLRAPHTRKFMPGYTLTDVLFSYGDFSRYFIKWLRPCAFGNSNIVICNCRCILFKGWINKLYLFTWLFQLQIPSLCVQMCRLFPVIYSTKLILVIQYQSLICCFTIPCCWSNVHYCTVW